MIEDISIYFVELAIGGAATTAFIIFHYLIKRYADSTVYFYMSQIDALIETVKSDGCTAPLKTYIHRWLKHSRKLCAAHDYGGLGLIDGARPGWHNNWLTWLAHMSMINPIYWVWGTIVSVWTLGWVMTKYNLVGWINKTFDKDIDLGNNSIGFGIVQAVAIALYFLIKYRPVS